MAFLTLQSVEFRIGTAIMQMESCGISDVGCKREKNEDSFLINPDLQIYMVADGMGGHVGGEFASKLAVKTVEEFVTRLLQDPNLPLESECDIKPGDYKSYLKCAITMASHRIFEKAANDSTLHGMGTTAVLLLFRESKVYVANVGDSRAYRIRGTKIEQLTSDHSLVGEQIRAGIIKPKEAKEHRLKNIITRSVGFQDDVEIDVETKTCKKGDVYLLCSDGLYNLVEDDEILDLILHHGLKESCRRLIDLANSRGGDDNVTVILTKVVSDNDEDETADDEETLQL